MINAIKIPLNTEKVEHADLGIKDAEKIISDAIVFVDHIALMLEQPDGTTTIWIDRGEVNSPLSLNKILYEIEQTLNINKKEQNGNS